MSSEAKEKDQEWKEEKRVGERNKERHGLRGEKERGRERLEREKE